MFYKKSIKIIIIFVYNYSVFNAFRTYIGESNKYESAFVIAVCSTLPTETASSYPY